MIPTYRSQEHLAHSIPSICGSPLKPRVLIVDSSSDDGTVEEAARLGAETLVIPKEEFNHGSTREMARKYLGTDIVVMMTPDAYPYDETMLGNLVAPIARGEASLAYGRQIPHEGAGPLESLPRRFNYGSRSHIRGIEDAGRYQVATFFCSNAWAAYRNAHLDEIGGFVPVLRAEDHVAAAMLLRKGRRIAYVAEAVVRHSHSPSLLDEFRHYFDVGYVMKEYDDLFSEMGRMENRGFAYVRNLTRTLSKEAPVLVPYGILHTFVKWLGYRIGRISLDAPVAIKRALSSESFYWSSNEYQKKCGR